ncbi:MAG: penicillin-insensitive murein endopeptidase [Pseudomonadota bacterium]
MRRVLALGLFVVCVGVSAPLAAEMLAKDHFSAIVAPSQGEAAAIGSYSRGCLAGGVQLAADGPSWQGMRLSRNRHFGHPTLIAFVEELAASAPNLGLRGLLVGDLSQPRGGPMASGHTSHQIGLDADFWFTEMPDEQLSPQERETLPFTSMLNEAGDGVDPDRFTEPFAKLLQLAASDGRVARIFVHPAIKRALCDWEGSGSGRKRDWLAKVRPWYGHHEHFHVRLKCPADVRCQPQKPPPRGDGCGAALDYWFTDAPYTPKPGAKPKLPLTLARLPAACRNLIPNPATPIPVARPVAAPQ